MVQLGMLWAGCPKETVQATSYLVSYVLGHLVTNVALSTIEKCYDQTTVGMPMALQNIKEDDHYIPHLLPIKNIDINDPSNKDQS